ncbi:hypothetical protein [Dokdonella soli]|uniref:Uncharacterized protein n=1 Tax=Dokdonella soli TaxID=529810 RepID=A0ABN1IDV4_9GAMM
MKHVTHLESKTADALRALRRLAAVAQRSGFLMLAIAAGEGIALLEDARAQELQFRDDRGIPR